MQKEIFSFKSKYFNTNLTSSLRDLFTNTSYSDVTLVSDDQIQFQAHKFVLSACSSVMKSSPQQSPSPPCDISRGCKTARVRLHTTIYVLWGVYGP